MDKQIYWCGYLRGLCVMGTWVLIIILDTHGTLGGGIWIMPKFLESAFDFRCVWYGRQPFEASLKNRCVWFYTQSTGGEGGRTTF